MKVEKVAFIHKQVEWRDYCKMIENLPYGLELICYKKEQKDNA